MSIAVSLPYPFNLEPLEEQSISPPKRNQVRILSALLARLEPKDFVGLSQTPTPYFLPTDFTASPIIASLTTTALYLTMRTISSNTEATTTNGKKCTYLASQRQLVIPAQQYASRRRASWLHRYDHTRCSDAHPKSSLYGTMAQRRCIV